MASVTNHVTRRGINQILASVQQRRNQSTASSSRAIDRALTSQLMQVVMRHKTKSAVSKPAIRDVTKCPKSWRASGVRQYSAANLSGVRQYSAANLSGVRQYSAANLSGVRQYSAANLSGVRQYSAANLNEKCKLITAAPQSPMTQQRAVRHKWI